VPPTQLNGTQVIADFLQHQRKLIHLLQLAEGKDINKIRVPISISPLIRLKLVTHSISLWPIITPLDADRKIITRWVELAVKVEQSVGEVEEDLFLFGVHFLECGGMHRMRLLCRRDQSGKAPGGLFNDFKDFTDILAACMIWYPNMEMEAVFAA